MSKKTSFFLYKGSVNDYTKGIDTDNGIAYNVFGIFIQYYVNRKPRAI